LSEGGKKKEASEQAPLPLKAVKLLIVLKLKRNRPLIPGDTNDP
jgi:hypothetical protein